MTQTIGCTVVGSANFSQGRISGAEGSAVLEADQSLSKVFIYSEAGSGTGTFDFAIYSADATIAFSPRIIYKTGVSFPVPAVSGWVEVSGFVDDLSEFESARLTVTPGNLSGFTGKTATGFVGSASSARRNNSLTLLADPFGTGTSFSTSDQNSFYIVTEPLGAGSDYTARKGSTATITHTLTSAGLTSATLNGQTVTIGTQSGQDAEITFTDTITTSDVYPLVVADGVGTQSFDVQYNVIGLTTNTIQKEGASIGARTDVEMHILDATGATVLGNLTGLTTDAAGDTGQAVVPLGAVDDPVRVSGYSEAAGIGFAYKTTLGLL